MNSQVSFQGLADAVVELLQWLMQAILDLYEWLPSEWPVFARVGVLLVGFVILVQIASGLFGLITRSPWKYIHRSILLFMSPFAKSRWASRRDLVRGKLTGKSGLFLGQWRRWPLRRQDMYFQGEGHVLTVADPRAGKTTGSIIPTLHEIEPDSSVAVVDTKGQIYTMTHENATKHGRTVKCLCPYYADFEKQTGMSFKDDGFNPVGFIENSPNTRAQADILARYLSVVDRKPASEYFKVEGTELLSLFISWIVRHERLENRNLTHLYEILRTNTIMLLDKMIAADDPLLMHDANRFKKMAKEAPAQWVGAVSIANQATKRYIPGTPLAVHTSKSGFNLDSLKNDNVTLYVMLPTQHIDTASSWLNMVMGLIGQSVGKAGVSRKVTIIIDELPALGFLPDLRNHMAQYTEAGLRMWLLTQSLSALYDEAMYGKSGLSTLFDLCNVKQFFNIRSHKSAKDISDYCGKTSAINRSQDIHDNTSVGVTEVPLISPDEINRLPKGKQILLVDDLPPIKGHIVPYFKRRKWRKKTGRNPFRTE